MTDLESPSAPDELYRYRGDDVPSARPILQGDVFGGVEIPGLDDGEGLAMIVTHACSMRGGPLLRARLLVARISERSQAIRLPWTGNYRYMPLPGLIPGEEKHWALTFEDMGTVPTATLDRSRRIACLDDRGLLLLQQRQAHHFTRVAVETAVLYEVTGGVLTRWCKSSRPHQHASHVMASVPDSYSGRQGSTPWRRTGAAPDRVAGRHPAS